MIERDPWEAAPPPGSAARKLLSAAGFYHHLMEAACQAQQQQRPVSVVILQMPSLSEEMGQRRRELEIALRLGVRRQDLVGRLSPGVLAVLLPGSIQDAERVAGRLSQLLSTVAGEAVATGIAVYPNDGVGALDLLRTATWRSLVMVSQPPRDRELERLLGWSSESTRQGP